MKKKAQAAADPLKPSAALLMKLGSIIVHADEFLSPDGHDFDKTAVEQLMKDPDVLYWLAQMDGMALIPKKRR